MKIIIGSFVVARMLNNTLTLGVHFSSTELNKILQYDKEKLRDDKKIIMKLSKNNTAFINPVNLKGAVDNGLVTKLEIVAKKGSYDLFKSPELQLVKNCGFKSLCITSSIILKLSHAEDIIKLINRYKCTLNQLECHFKKVNITDFSKIYEELENWIINASLNISLTAEKDVHNKICKSLMEYNYIQAKIKLALSCALHSKHFADTNKTIDERTQEYENIVKKDQEFIKNFSKCEPSFAKKIMGDNMYSTFLRCYISNSAIVKTMSEYCYNYTQQKEKSGKTEYLPYHIQKCIVKHIGGIAAITEIDNALENNSVTDQQDEFINQAEPMNDINLTTRGTTVDCSDCLFYH